MQPSVNDLTLQQYPMQYLSLRPKQSSSRQNILIDNKYSEMTSQVKSMCLLLVLLFRYYNSAVILMFFLRENEKRDAQVGP